MHALHPTLCIRSVTEADLPELFRLDSEVFEFEAYPFFLWRQFYELYASQLLVLDGGTALHGYVLAGSSATGPTWLLGLGVTRDLRGLGLGRRLIAEMLHRLRSEDVREVRLTVEPANEAAISLYTSLGFTPVGGAHKDYFGPGRDRLVMMLSL